MFITGVSDWANVFGCHSGQTVELIVNQKIS